MDKVKTNRQALNKAIKELSDLDLVFLRDCILSACDKVLDNEEQIREDMVNHVISPNLYIEAMRNIKSKVDFEWNL